MVDTKDLAVGVRTNPDLSSCSVASYLCDTGEVTCLSSFNTKVGVITVLSHRVIMCFRCHNACERALWTTVLYKCY